MKDLFQRHGKSDTSEYKSWQSMKSRCCNPNSKSYKNYGGRGIKLLTAWHFFPDFYADMGDKPTPEHTIERINNHGNYEPSNCRWATVREQMSNKRSNVWLTFGGETLNITQWAERININRQTLGTRLRKGWSIERALTQPVANQSRKKPDGDNV